MDRCVTEIPPLREVDPGGHRSACWLPVELHGLSDETEQAREKFAAAARSGATDELATAVDQAAELEGHAP